VRNDSQYLRRNVVRRGQIKIAVTLDVNCAGDAPDFPDERLQPDLLVFAYLRHSLPSASGSIIPSSEGKCNGFSMN
jgi:hypothetical protein